MESRLEITCQQGICRVSMNRPDVRNAFDDHLAQELAQTFLSIAQDESLRVVVLEGRGKVFSAGGDLNWMRRIADYSYDENLADAEAFQRAFEAIERCPVPVIGRIQGAALGGGAGLVAVCDIAIAAKDAVMGFPEVRLGLVPGVISPYVVRKIGLSAARHLFVTGERLDAVEAHRLGLVQVLCEADELDACVDRLAAQVSKGSPEAVRAAKQLAFDVAEADSAQAALQVAREAIAAARASEDGREGTRAFLEKRSPEWTS